MDETKLCKKCPFRRVFIRAVQFSVVAFIVAVLLLVCLPPEKRDSVPGILENQGPLSRADQRVNTHIQAFRLGEWKSVHPHKTSVVKDVAYSEDKAQQVFAARGSDDKEDKNSDCSNGVTRKEINELCKLYHQGLVAGDLCSPLCDFGQIQLIECGTARHVQKRVMKVSCSDACSRGNTIQAFLKTDVTDIREALRNLPEWQKPKYGDINDASRNLIQTYVMEHVGFNPYEDLDILTVVWGHGQVTEQDVQHVQYASAVWRSLSLLLPRKGNSEYVMAKLFQRWRIFPEVFGSCGHFYVEESCPPRPPDWIPPELDHLGRRQASWIRRAGDALNALAFLERMETELPDKLVGCDIKIDNFGFCGDGDLRIIDSNSFFFNSATSFLETKPCTVEGAACKVYGRKCMGTCDALRGKCVIKDSVNLEYMCRGVFMVRADMTNPQYHVDGRGELLRDPPLAVAKDLIRALHACASLSQLSTHESWERRRVLEELKTVLNRSLLHPQH